MPKATLKEMYEAKKTKDEADLAAQRQGSATRYEVVARWSNGRRISIILAAEDADAAIEESRRWFNWHPYTADDGLCYEIILVRREVKET